jgi:hypothetical protein
MKQMSSKLLVCFIARKNRSGPTLATAVRAQRRVQRDDVQRHIAVRPSDIAKLPEDPAKVRLQKREHDKASGRAKLQHPLPDSQAPVWACGWREGS